MNISVQLRALVCACATAIGSSSAVADATAPRLLVQAATGSMAGTTQLVMSSDGTLLASADALSGGVQLWELANGRKLCAFAMRPTRGATFSAYGAPPIAFSRDGRSLLSAMRGGQLATWDLASCRQVGTLPGPGGTDVKQMLPLPDGRQLLLDEDGRLFRGDAFSPSPSFAATPAPPGLSALLGVSIDGQRALVASRNLAQPLAPPKLHLLDLRAGTSDALAGYKAGSDAPPSTLNALTAGSVLSPSGRWVLVHSQNRLQLLDSRTRVVAASVQIGGATDPGRSATPPAPNPLQPSRMQEQVRQQIEQALASVPPFMREQLRKQIESQMPQVEDTVNRASDIGAEVQRSGGLPPLPGWAGFTSDEKQALVWRNVTQDGGAAGRRLNGVLEVRTLPSLALEREVTLSSLETIAGTAAFSFATSPDRRWLAATLPTPDAGGLHLARVDLTVPKPEAQTWRANGGAGSVLSWSAEDRLMALQAPQYEGAAAALDRRGDPIPPLAARPSSSQGDAAVPRLARAYGVSWSLGDGEVATQVSSSPVPGLPRAIAPGGSLAAIARVEIRDVSKALSRTLIDVLEGHRLTVLRTLEPKDRQGQPLQGVPSALALSADGAALAVAGLVSGATPMTSVLAILDGRDGRLLHTVEVPVRVADHRAGSSSLRFSADGRRLVMVGDQRAAMIDLGIAGAPRVTPISVAGGVIGLVGEAGATLLIGEGRARGQENTAGLPVLRVPRAPGTNVFAVDPGGRWLAMGGPAGAAALHSVAGDKLGAARPLPGLTAALASFTFSPDARRLAGSAVDGTTIVWDTGSGDWVLKLFSFSDGGWAVVDPAGRFDTNRIEELESLHWVVPSQPFRALPLDIFMRQYFQPDLLRRVMARETLPPVPDLRRLNTAQPIVRIAAVTPRGPDRVDVTVEAEGTPDASGREGGVQEVRLFRDGRLVGVRLGEAGANGLRTTVQGVRLPTGGRDVELAAYAFNRDGVKSATVRRTHRINSAAAARRAWLLSIGVNTYDDPRYNLRYAVNDARATQRALRDSLLKHGGFAEVRDVALLAETGATRSATKALIKQAFASLQAATPDDAVIISFAGHGSALADGRFAIFPQDVRSGHDPREQYPNAIYADELSDWLTGVDSGELTILVDACQSAAAVDSAGFKPGPLGARGLGQLAYDKGARLLAATQVDSDAIEQDRLQHGILTFALVREGLDRGRADFRPADRQITLREWLSYGVARVPGLQSELPGGRRGLARPGPVSPGTARPGASPRPTQQPRLFDFARRHEDPLLATLP
jgi:hypothetical protein